MKMEYPPTREKYNELINKVKLLEQKNKQKNDDITHKTMKKNNKASKFKKADVELKSIPKEEGKKKTHRNTWAEIYHNNTVRRKSMRILGEDVIMDDWLDWRVKWGQRGMVFFGLIALISIVLARTDVGILIAILFASIALLFAGLLYYKNVSFVIIKELLKETTVIVIVILSSCIWIIEIVRPITPVNQINGLMYMLIINAFVFLDALKVKSRIFLIIWGSLVTILNIKNIYTHIFANASQGIVLFNYTIQGEEYTIMKRSTKRSIFLQVFLFNIKAVYTMFKDKKMELLIFATGNIYRETGTAFARTKNAYPPTLDEYNELVKKVKLMEQTKMKNKNDTTQKTMMEKKKASKFTKVEVEIESIPKRGRKNTPRRNSWAETYHNNAVRRKSMKLLGEDVIMDDWLDWRVKWGQRGVGICGFLGVLCFIADGTNVGLLSIAAIIFAIPAIICIGILYYKNVSLVIIKRLLKEANVVVIILLTILNWIIEIGRPMTPLSPIMGFIYMLMINAFVFMDAIKLKSRMLVIIGGSLSTVLNIYNIYNRLFGNADKGVVLFNYTIQGEEYTIMKRSIQRSIYLQVFLFSMTAVYTMFKDKKMELMIFATGNIYRETGTASKEIEDKIFSKKLKREQTSTLDQSNQQSNSRKNEIQSVVEKQKNHGVEQYDEYVQNPLHNTTIKHSSNK
eukprot:g10630.t1